MTHYIPSNNPQKVGVCCYLCSNTEVTDFFEMPPVPTQDGRMADSKDAALSAVKGTISLRFCHHCGYIGNEGYDAGKITFDTYDFSLDHSPLFSEYIKDLCSQLITRYNLKNKTVLDIGCGDGVFLQTICEMGNNQGIGIDSGFDHSKRKNPEHLDIRYLQEYYAKKHQDIRPDFISCRLVIDLLEDPIGFLKLVRSNLENCPESLVFFEVPLANYTFEEKIIWNVVYEHRSWFNPQSFRYLFELCGFEVLDTLLLWNEEYLGIVARPAANPTHTASKPGLEHWPQTINHFGATFDAMVHSSRRQIQQIREQQLKVLAWGAGARALTFFNQFDLLELIPCIIDINEKRQGKFLPGSGQRIVAPDFALHYRPDLIIITNPTYAEEIKAQVQEMGIDCEFWVI